MQLFLLSYTYISVKLPNKAGEVIVLEVLRKKIPCKIQLVPNNETAATRAPRDSSTCHRIIHHVISLSKEWGSRTRGPLRSISQIHQSKQSNLHLSSSEINKKKLKSHLAIYLLPRWIEFALQDLIFPKTNNQRTT